VLAHLMVAAGMRLDGVVLQSPALDYNSNCAGFPPATLSCEGFLPSYGLTGAWFARTNPVPSDADAYAGQLRDFAADDYGPAATAWVQNPHAGRRRRSSTSSSPSPARRSTRGPRTSTSTRSPSATACCRASSSAATTRASPRRSAARSRAGNDPVVDADQRAVRRRGEEPLRRRAPLRGDARPTRRRRTRSTAGTSATTAAPCPTPCPISRRR
jgi:hypothetical protein